MKNTKNLKSEINLSLNTDEKVTNLYTKPLPASRSGALYNAFPYPTKISPESIAVFIASHTKPGDTILDTFGGSGTTGMAAHLCSNPSDKVIELAKELDAPVEWGKRNAIIYELSTLGSFVAKTMAKKINSKEFLQVAQHILTKCEESIGDLYTVKDDEGNPGKMRHAIWSDILKCPSCNLEVSFWDVAVEHSPLKLKDKFVCPNCSFESETSKIERVYEEYFDQLLGKMHTRKKRVIKRVYGRTGKRLWQRPASQEDEELIKKIEERSLSSSIPIKKIPWGDLYRSGYHKGITHIHHFYTRRNLIVMSELWSKIKEEPIEFQDALKLLVLSYNSSHSTLMSRVVVKSGQSDFVLTSAQSGVLYISSLPVEKNIFEGLHRKSKTIGKAFALLEHSTSNVEVVNGSSTNLDIKDKSIDYVFTDPPFGDYIPYAELNFINEAWLDDITNQTNEIIISQKQDKSVNDYATLMTEVFNEINRTLKDNGACTVVFHSAKAEVWKALQDAYKSAGLKVRHSSILDKLQGSFKQVSGNVSVKGDPLLCLVKGENSSETIETEINLGDLISDLIEKASNNVDNKELTVERIYSRLVTYYLQMGKEVPMDAADFYKRLKPILNKVIEDRDE